MAKGITNFILLIESVQLISFDRSIWFIEDPFLLISYSLTNDATYFYSINEV